MKYFSLFTGVGGFEIGIEKAYARIQRLSNNDSGGDQSVPSVAVEHGRQPSGRSRPQNPVCVGFSEIDKYASAVLRYRFPNVKNYGDITKIDWSTVPDFDLLVGGSPCQDLSVAGLRRGLSGERSGLFSHYARALQEKQPRHFIWENVKGALSSGGGKDFATILNTFSEAGYSFSWQVLNAKDFGVPQNRERVFVVGTRGSGGREVFFETGAGRQDTEAGVNAEQGAQSIATRHLDRNGGLIADHASAVQVAEVPHILRWQNKNDGVVESEIAPALRASSGSDIRKKPMTAMEGRIRRLTPTETERLMSWPDDWTKTGRFCNEKIHEGVECMSLQPISDTQRYKMAGNGVVSNVVAEIVKAYLL